MNGRFDAPAALPRAPVARRFALVTLIGAALFVVLRPEPTSQLDGLTATIYWAVSFATGLAFASAASLGLSRMRRLRDMPVLLRLALAGWLGLMLFVPIAQMIEAVLPSLEPNEEVDDWLDVWEAAGGWRAYLAEALQAGPAYLLTWTLVNVAQRDAPPATDAAGAPPPPSSTLIGPEAQVLAAPADHVQPASAEAELPDEARRPAGGDLDFWARLPPAIGRDLITISADLHYLHVTTRGGRATVLDALGAVEAQLEPLGMRIHRSHWVADASVRRLAKSPAGWFCEMHNGDRMPVSRRRVAQAQARYGAGFVAVSATTDVPSRP